MFTLFREYVIPTERNRSEKEILTLIKNKYVTSEMIDETKIIIHVSESLIRKRYLS